MLATFRNHAKGWAAWIFVIIVTIPFAFWGISQYRSLVTTDYVAKVNGEKIMPPQFQREYQRAYEQRQQTQGGKFNPTQKEQQALKEQVLQQLIGQTLLRQQASTDRMVVGDADVQAQIRQVASFQSGGHFDFQRYRAVLASNNFTVDQFESNVREDLRVQQLQGGVTRTAFAVPHEVATTVGLLKEKRKVAWFTVPLANYKPDSPPSDAEIAAYYKAHKDEYSTPTTLTIRYVRLDQAALQKRVQVTPTDLQDYYDTHQNQYGIPPARKAAQILIKPDGSGPQAEAVAEAKVETLKAELGHADDPQALFAKLARAQSQDKTSSRNGGSLGWIARGQMPKAFDNALFGIQKVGEIAGPVRTADGWHLIQLLGERGGTVKPFSEVQSQVKSDYLQSKANDLYYQLGDELANKSYEHPDSLGPVAKALGLEVQTVSGVTRDKGTGIAANDKVREAAFSDAVMKQNQNSQPIKLGTDDAVVLRVDNVEPSHARPLSDVRSEVVAAIMHHQAEQALQQATNGALKALRAGKDMQRVALDMGLALQGPAEVERSGSDLPPGLASAVFSTPPGVGGARRFGSTGLQGGDNAVYAVVAVIPGSEKSLKQEEQQGFLQELGQLNAEQSLDDYVAWLRSQADIKIDKDNIP